MTDKEGSDDVASGLTKILLTASQLDEESDFEDLLEAIRVLRRQWPGASTVAAWRYVRRHAWADVRRALEEEDDQAQRSGLQSALMAVFLFSIEDPLWHSYARAATEQRENPEAAKIGHQLLEHAARTDPRATTEPAATAGKASDARTGLSAPTTWIRA